MSTNSLFDTPTIITDHYLPRIYLTFLYTFLSNELVHATGGKPPWLRTL